MASRSEGSGVFGRLEDISKAAVFSIGVFYVIGLIVVNSELGFYGVYSMELGRPEYILAGALWVFLTLLPILVLRYYRSLTSPIEWKGDWNYYALGTRALNIGIAFLAFSWFLQILSGGELAFVGEREFFNWPGTIATLTAAGVFCAPAFLLTELYRTRLARFQGRELTLSLLMERPDLPFNLAYVFMTTLMFLGAYSTLVFPHLEMRYGGGKHPNVEIVLSQAINLAWKTNQIPVSPDGLKIGPALLLLETLDTIVITKPRIGTETWGRMFRADAFALKKERVIAYRFIGNHLDETPETQPLPPERPKTPR
jgi:hypothetical protein